MHKYGGFLLASILVVWIVIGSFVLASWLRERKYFS